MVRRETWNWIIGLVFIVLVAVIWIAASFVVQTVVDSGISPFLISYICNSLFIVYIPIVEVAWCLKRHFFKAKVDDQKIKDLTNLEKAQLLEAVALDNSITVEIPPDDDEQVNLPLNEMKDGIQAESSSPIQHMWTRKETAKVSLMICPVWFLAQLTFNLSLKYTTVTSNTILSSTSTLFTFLVSLAFLGESFSIIKMMGVVLCMAGSIIVAFGDSEATTSTDVASHPVLGDGFCLVSAMFYAAYTTLIRKKFPDENNTKERVSTALFLGYLGLFNALIFLPVVLLLHFTGLEPLHRLSRRQLGLIVGKGLFDNALSDYLWAKAVLLTTTTVATAGLTLQVPIAAIVDSLRGHAPGTLNILGAVAVLVGFFGLNQPADCCSRKELKEEGTETSPSHNPL